MTIVTALLLAVVMGITEIIPVSGTGHLYLFAKLLGVPTGDGVFASFRGMLYLGVALALLMYYRRQVADVLTELMVLLGLRRPPRRRQEAEEKRRALLLLCALTPMVPALLLGGLRRRVETGDHTLLLTALFLCLSGVTLYFAARGARGKRTDYEMTLADAVTVGLSQIPTVFPGLSRTGLTLSALLNHGFEKNTALEFSGLMGIPVLLGAGLSQLIPPIAAHTAAETPYLILAFAVAALSAYATLRIFSRRIGHRRSTVYAYWCWGAGILALVLFLVSA